MNLATMTIVHAELQKLAQKCGGVLDILWVEGRFDLYQLGGGFLCSIYYHADAGPNKWVVDQDDCVTYAEHHCAFDCLMLWLGRRVDHLELQRNRVQKIKEKIGP